MDQRRRLAATPVFTQDLLHRVHEGRRIERLHDVARGPPEDSRDEGLRVSVRGQEDVSALWLTEADGTRDLHRMHVRELDIDQDALRLQRDSGRQRLVEILSRGARGDEARKRASITHRTADQQQSSGARADTAGGRFHPPSVDGCGTRVPVRTSPGEGDQQPHVSVRWRCAWHTLTCG